MLAKHMMMLSDAAFHDILAFLDAGDAHGKTIMTVITQMDGEADPARHNVSYEARQLKKLFLKLRQ